MEIANVSHKLSGILNNMGITTVITHNMSYLDIDDDENHITFIPTDKVNMVKFKGGDVWVDNRNKMKIGRFLKDILSIDDSTIENLVSQYITYYKIETGRIDEIFDIVDGKEIHRCYQKENYVPGGGSLWGSCMGNAAENRLEMYIKNPKKVKLLVIKQGNKISGRALMWTTDKGIYIDRPYCRYDKDLRLYQLYAEKMGFTHYYKNRNDRKTVKINVPRNHPYLDTFKVINNKTIQI